MSGYDLLSPKEQFALILMASAALYKTLYEYSDLNESVTVNCSNV